MVVCAQSLAFDRPPPAASTRDVCCDDRVYVEKFVGCMRFRRGMHQKSHTLITNAIQNTSVGLQIDFLIDGCSESDGRCPSRVWASGGQVY